MTDFMDYVEVLVKMKGDNVRYRCSQRPVSWGETWKCGRCGHGSLGPIPKHRQRCMVCDAFVCDITVRGPFPG